MTNYIPPQDPDYVHVQQASAEETRRIEEYQKQLAHQQKLEAERRSEELERQPSLAGIAAVRGEGPMALQLPDNGAVVDTDDPVLKLLRKSR